MLEAGRYPELEFRSNGIVPAGLNRFDVQGTLTMRGVPRPATVRVSVKPGLVFEGSARLKMTGWGMKPPSAALGMVGTQDEMDVSFTLTGSTPPR